VTANEGDFFVESGVGWHGLLSSSC